MNSISVDHLTKFYGKTCGIEDVSFAVPKGSIFGFLGPNGAGKTTTIRILLDIVRPSRGAAWLFGQSITPSYPAELRRQIGYLPGELRLYEELTGSGYLQLMGRFYGTIDAGYRSQLLQDLDLAPSDLERPLREYSHGMRQKIGLVHAMQHQPELLILDEPTEGLDPLIRTRFYELLAEQANQGTTVFMSSHNLAEVERVCEQVAILRQGRLLTTQTVKELKAVRLYQLEIELVSEAAAGRFTLVGAENLKQNGSRLSLRWRGDFAALFSQLQAYEMSDFSCKQADLEEIFLAYYRPEGGDEQ